MEPESKGSLVVWMNVDPAASDDFDAWYVQEHIPERVGVPGFISGNRYKAVSGDPHSMAVYETENPQVLFSKPYLERLNDPTPWTQRVMPAFRDTIRSPCRVILDRGQGTGGLLRTFRLEPRSGQRDRLRAALCGPLADRLTGHAGVLRVRCVEAVTPDEKIETNESAMRAQKDQVATFVLLIDGTDGASLEAACAEEVSGQRLEEMGAQSPVPMGEYRLLYSLVK